VPDTQLKRNLPIELVDGRVTGESCRMLGFGWEARAEGESVEVWDAFVFVRWSHRGHPYLFEAGADRALFRWQEGQLDMLELRLAETFDSIDSFFVSTLGLETARGEAQADQFDSVPTHPDLRCVRAAVFLQKSTSADLFPRRHRSPQRLLSERPSHVTLPPNFGRFASKLHILHLDQSSASAADAQHAALHDRMSSYWAIRQSQRERQIKGLEPNEGIPAKVPRIIEGAMEALVRRETVEVVRACRAGDDEGLRLSMEPFVSARCLLCAIAFVLTAGPLRQLYSFALPLVRTAAASPLARTPH
jgi:hypothetical protein